MRLLNEILSEDELKQLADDGILEQKSLVLSRGNHFEVFYAGTDEMHRAWFEKFRKCCILHRFKRRYNLLNNIGKGSTSTIYEAVCLSTNRLVAVKIFDKIKIISTSPNISPTDNNNKIFLSIENEINILSRLDHESILQIHEVYEGSKFIVLVFEKLNGGDFYQKLISKSSNFTEDEIKKIMKQLISAVKYLHDKEIMHRDIKPENIFFLKNDELDLKLGDFGLAEYEKKDNLLSIRCGTPGYVAPEIFLNKKYSKKCDMFSLGVLLYVM